MLLANIASLLSLLNGAIPSPFHSSSVLAVAQICNFMRAVQSAVAGRFLSHIRVTQFWIFLPLWMAPLHLHLDLSDNLLPG